MKHSLKELVVKYGKEPELMLVTDINDLKSSRVDDDIADKYAIFFNDKALGGCIVYAQYGHGEQEWPVKICS